jgi:hypothetical protein
MPIAAHFCSARGSDSSARKLCSQATLDISNSSDKKKKVRQNRLTPGEVAALAAKKEECTFRLSARRPAQRHNPRPRPSG